MKLNRIAAALCAIGLAGVAHAEAGISDGIVKVGVLTDLSGVYSDLAGNGSVVAARMAAEEMGNKVLGKPVEVVAADHQNKPDVGTSLVVQLFSLDLSWLSPLLIGFGVSPEPENVDPSAPPPPPAALQIDKYQEQLQAVRDALQAYIDDPEELPALKKKMNMVTESKYVCPSPRIVLNTLATNARHSASATGTSMPSARRRKSFQAPTKNGAPEYRSTGVVITIPTYLR